jgi:hypothetical protein
VLPDQPHPVGLDNWHATRNLLGGCDPTRRFHVRFEEQSPSRR